LEEDIEVVSWKYLYVVCWGNYVWELFMTIRDALEVLSLAHGCLLPAKTLSKNRERARGRGRESAKEQHISNKPEAPIDSSEATAFLTLSSDYHVASSLFSIINSPKGCR
jgi:hypothetical protein